MFDLFNQKIKLAFAASTKNLPYSNFGDALSAIIVSALTNREIVCANFQSSSEKMSAVGTILQNFKNGRVNVWGTGLDVTINHVDKAKHYFNPLQTKADYRLYAVRGRITASVFEQFGYKDPGVYGDPAILCQTFFQSYGLEKKQTKLGFVGHLTDLESYSDQSNPRKQLASLIYSPDVKFISPITKPKVAAVLEKVREIACCEYVLSKSLHGLIIAEIFNVPCALAVSGEVKSGRYSVYDYTQCLDHRARDFYSGVDVPTILAYNINQDRKIDFEKVRAFLDENWMPLPDLEEKKKRLISVFPERIVSFREMVNIPESMLAVKI